MGDDHRQLVLRLFGLFTWEHGDCKFRSDHPEPPTSVPLETTTEAIIFDGIRKNFTIERLQRHLKRYLEMSVIPSPGFPTGGSRVKFDEVDERILSCINGNRTLKHILEKEPDHTRVFQLVYALRCFGMVSFRTELEDEVTSEVPGLSPFESKEQLQRGEFSPPPLSLDDED